MRVLPFAFLLLFAAVSPAPVEASVGDRPAFVESTFSHAAAMPVAVDLMARSPPSVGEVVEVVATLSLRVPVASPVVVTVEHHVWTGLAKLAPVPVEVVLGPEAPASVVLPLRVEAPGVSKLVVAVQGRPGVAGHLEGQRIAYLDVPEEGPGAFHVDLLPSVGPVVVAPTVTSVPEGLHPLTQTLSVTACFRHLDGNGLPQPTRWAKIDLWDHDPGAVDDQIAVAQIADGTGCTTWASVPRTETDGNGGNVELYARALLTNDQVVVRNMAGQEFAFVSSVVAIGSESSRSFMITSPAGGEHDMAARQFVYTNNAWDYTRNYHTAWDPPLVNVEAPSTTCTCYSLTLDTIRIEASSDFAPDVTIHEYGHFVMEKSYGELAWPSPNGDHHFCQDAQHRGLALAEGFANYWGVRANYELGLAGVVGADGDTSYRGGGWLHAWNMETYDNRCPSRPQGDDSEWNVAMAFWDLHDEVNEGPHDVATISNAAIRENLSCRPQDYREYYDRADCSWTQRQRPVCDFVRAALQNTIDYQAAQQVLFLTQTAYRWERGSIPIGASITDPDACAMTAQFRVSADSTCTATDINAGTRSSSPWQVTFNTATLVDDVDYWACLTVTDPLQTTANLRSPAAFGVDNTLPIATAGHTCSFPGNGGWCRGSVTYTLSSSDAMSGIASSACALDGASIACGSGTVTALGPHTATVTATDRAGNSASASTTFRIDNVPPSVTPVANCSVPGQNGWCRGSVSTNIDMSDATSGIGGTSCWLDGVSRPCSVYTVTGQGTHSWTVNITDGAGNWRNVTLYFHIDSVPPSASASHACPRMGGDGWCREPVTVSFTGTDSGSGVGSLVCTLDGAPFPCTPSSVGTDGSHTAVVTVTDVAGNSATASTTFRIDRSAPSFAPSSSCSDPGSNGWCRGLLEVSTSASDPASGLASFACTVEGAPVACGAFATDAPGMHAYEARASDRAGNEGTSSRPLRVDAVPPVVGATHACALPGNAGWCRSPVDVTLSASDAHSGIETASCALAGAPAPCGSARTTAEGPQVASVEATDAAGNSAEASTTFQVDTIAPLLLTDTFCSFPGTNQWCRGSVTVKLGATDAGSGLATLVCNPVCGTSTREGSQATTVSVSASDVAGNPASRSVLVRIDEGAPIVTLATRCDSPGNGAWCRGKVNVTLGVTDGVSGVGPSTCRLDGVERPCGSFDVSAPGAHTFEVTAFDRAGNSASRSVAFSIDDVAPSASVTAPALSIGPYEVLWSASDAHSHLDSFVLMEWRAVGELFWSPLCGPAVSGPTASGSCPGDPRRGGACYRLVVYDLAGNSAVSPEACAVTV